MIELDKSSRTELGALGGLAILSTFLPMGGFVLYVALLYVLFRNMSVLAEPADQHGSARAQSYVLSTFLFFSTIFSLVAGVSILAIIPLIFIVCSGIYFIGLAMDMEYFKQKLTKSMLALEVELGMSDEPRKRLYLVNYRDTFAKLVKYVRVAALTAPVMIAGGMLMMFTKQSSVYPSSGLAFLGAAVAIGALLAFGVYAILLFISQFKILNLIRKSPFVFKFTENSLLAQAAIDLNKAALYPFGLGLAYGVVLSISVALGVISLLMTPVLGMLALPSVAFMFFILIIAPVILYFILAKRFKRASALVDEALLTPEQ